MTFLKDSSVTFGVSSIASSEALLLCISSVLHGMTLPGKIQVRLEGHFPSFSRFYLEQLSELARFKGVEFSLTVDKSRGVRYARDWHLNNCRTDYLWMGDDDVVYDHYCLDQLTECMKLARRKWPIGAAYVCGSKGDINNRRGYADFDLSIHKAADLHDDCPFHWFYDFDSCKSKIVEVCTMDTGNVLIAIPMVRDQMKVRFSFFDDSTNAGGEDTLFAMSCRQSGMKGFFAPAASSIHLEKEKVNFSEFEARKEMILRVAQLRGFKPEIIESVRRVFNPKTK